MLSKINLRLILRRTSSNIRTSHALTRFASKRRIATRIDVETATFLTDTVNAHQKLKVDLASLIPGIYVSCAPAKDHFLMQIIELIVD
jgi:hypothetical protein